MAAKKDAEKQNLNLKGFKINNVRRISEKVVSFSLIGNGLGLYNLKIVDGSNGKFISAPSQKGKDDKYYPVYRVYISDADASKLIKKVLEMLAEQDEEGEDEDLPF